MDADAGAHDLPERVAEVSLATAGVEPTSIEPHPSKDIPLKNGIRIIREALRPRLDPAIRVALSTDGLPPSGEAFLIAYWETQHQRVAAHEDVRLQLSGFVMAGSLGAALAAGTEAIIPTGRLAIWIVIALANVIAIAMTRSELRWIKVHQERAGAVLQLLSPSLADMQKVASARWLIDETKRSRNMPRFTSSEALILIHILITVSALVVAVSAAWLD